MKPSQIKELLKSCYEQRKPKPIIMGSPGCGKTAIVYQLFREEMKLPVYVFQAMLYDPVEIKGLPVYIKGDGEVAKFIRFEDMPTAEEGVLFVDDLPHAPTQTQNAFMRLILEGVAGSWDLGGLFPIAAGNRATDRAGAKELQTAIANRFIRVDFTIDYEDWRSWAIQKNITPEIVAYLATPYGRDWLDKFDPTHQINPTPRSWEFASDLWKTCPKHIIREALYGTIGEEATSKFMGWLKVYDKLPDLQQIIAGKNIYAKELDVMYAVISGLVSIAASFEKKKTIFQRLVTYICSMPEEFKELGAWLSKDLCKLDYTTFSQCNLETWRDKYSDVIIDTQ